MQRLSPGRGFEESTRDIDGVQVNSDLRPVDGVQGVQHSLLEPRVPCNVSEERRGRGIGKALLVFLAREASARGWARLEWSVLDWNTPAIRFYETLGARAMDQWTTFRLTGEALENLGNGS